MKIVYAIKNKLYIGSSRQKGLARWKAHRKELINNKHCNTRLQRAWNKYGIENFELVIIEELDDNQDQFIREQYWIDYHRSYEQEFGYNGSKTAGRVDMTDEVKEKIRQTMKGRPLSQEHIKAFSQAKIGEKRSNEAKEKIRQSKIGRKLTEETKSKISQGGKGLKRSEETCKRISESRQGKKFPRNM